MAIRTSTTTGEANKESAANSIRTESEARRNSLRRMLGKGAHLCAHKPPDAMYGGLLIRPRPFRGLESEGARTQASAIKVEATCVSSKWQS